MTEKTEVIKAKTQATPEMVKEAIKSEESKPVTKISEPAFSKSQILKSNKFVLRQDALNVLLKDDRQYTYAQVDALLKQFYEGGKK